MTKKLFWPIFILFNLLWLPLLFFVFFISIAEMQINNDGFSALIGMVVILIILVIFMSIAIADVFIISRYKMPKAKWQLAIFLFFTVLAIAIYIPKGNYIYSQYQASRHINIQRDKLTYETAKNYEDCRSINNSELLYQCAIKVLDKTKDLVGCFKLSLESSQRDFFMEDPGENDGNFRCYLQYNSDILKDEKLLNEVLLVYKNAEKIIDELQKNTCQKIIIEIQKKSCPQKLLDYAYDHCISFLIKRSEPKYLDGTFIFDKNTEDTLTRGVKEYITCE